MTPEQKKRLTRRIVEWLWKFAPDETLTQIAKDNGIRIEV
jgi:hypothetical protein